MTYQCNSEDSTLSVTTGRTKVVMYSSVEASLYIGVVLTCNAIVSFRSYPVAGLTFKILLSFKSCDLWFNLAHEW